MKIPFYKYHGAGNDFILVDDRADVYDRRLDQAMIEQICHRHFGIGADGLILLQKAGADADFFMKYYNADGRTSSFCGNGGRCVVAFAHHLGIHSGHCLFLGTDGLHQGDLNGQGDITLSMQDVEEIHALEQDAFRLDTGSPHYVQFVRDVQDVDVVKRGREIRHRAPFEKEGINVNFVEKIKPGEIRMRTYERGVENETLACGTGVVAGAIAAAFTTEPSISHWTVHARGGILHVDFIRGDSPLFREVKLTGPAVASFRGEFEIPG